MAIVVQQGRGEPATATLSKVRHPGRIHPGRAGRCDQQPAEQRVVRELQRRYAEEVGGEMNVVAVQVRRAASRAGMPR